MFLTFATNDDFPTVLVCKRVAKKKRDSCVLQKEHPKVVRFLGGTLFFLLVSSGVCSSGWVTTLSKTCFNNFVIVVCFKRDIQGQSFFWHSLAIASAGFSRFLLISVGDTLARTCFRNFAIAVCFKKAIQRKLIFLALLGCFSLVFLQVSAHIGG